MPKFFLFLIFIENLYKTERSLNRARILEDPIQEEAPKQNEDPNKIHDCNEEMMLSYGLTGKSKPDISTHKFCPKISLNCCSHEDQVLSKQLWDS